MTGDVEEAVDEDFETLNQLDERLILLLSAKC
jgi:hypothetical protein